MKCIKKMIYLVALAFFLFFSTNTGAQRQAMAAKYMKLAFNEEIIDLPVVQKLGIYPGYGNSKAIAKHKSIEDQLGRRIIYANSFAATNSWGGVGSTTWGQFVDSSAFFVNRKDVIPIFAIPLRTSETRYEVNKPGGPELIRKGLFDTANGVNDATTVKLVKE